MHKSPILLSLLLLTLGCKTDKDAKPQLAIGCNDSRSLRDKEYTNLRTTVLRQINGNNVEYILDRPDTSNTVFSLPIRACNLPESFRRDSLRVRVSGYTIKNSTKVDFLLPVPFEITKIEEL